MEMLNGNGGKPGVYILPHRSVVVAREVSS